MGIEIERKFLVKNKAYRGAAKGEIYKQGYLSTDKERVVRVRIIGDKGFLTIKGRTEGCRRLEFEYEIPLKDADELLNNLCQRPIIEKHRYKLSYQGFVWEIDEFHGENEGLVVAEIELEDAHMDFAKPDWAGPEVTDDPRYYNSNLAQNPYRNWAVRD